MGRVLCGHDGRVGYLHHLAVAHSERRQGIGSELVRRCLSGLAGVGIPEAYAFVQRANRPGQAFWIAHGWANRSVETFSVETSISG